MTVTYTAEVATVKGFGCFLRLLFRWKGSIYKLVWPDVILFLVIYYALNIMYRFLLNEDEKRVFESIAEYCETQSNFIPLSFVLGFYVSIVMTRWWDQYNNIPWPDPIAVYVSAHVHGQDERGRLMRRTVMRYCCLCLTMVFTMISPRVKKRFPTINHFVEAGLLLDSEKIIINDLDEKFPRHAKHWLPIVWAASIITRARKEGRIRDDFAVKTIIDELNKFRGMCGQLLNYDSISVPLVYTQVVTLAVYTFFATCIMGRQWIDKQSTDGVPSRYKIDLYFPIFTLLQFFFYMGWLKVAESLINPFGEDDDDFEVNWLVDRNLQVSYLIVDEMHHEHPELIKDQYWDEVFPTELPYTIASEPFREQHPQPSTANIEIPKSAAEISSLKVDEIGDHVSYQFDDNLSGIHFFAGGKRNSSRIDQRERALSGSSSSSTVNFGSMAHSINRVGSIASMLKNIFSREGSNSANTDKVATQSMNLGSVTGSGRIHSSQSAASLPKSLGTGGTLRITDQVIEEVDEQMTLTSMKRQSPDRLNVRDIFSNTGRPAPSEPVDVPMNSYSRNITMSISAPSDTAPNLSEFAIPCIEDSIQSAPIFDSPTTVPMKAELDDMSLGSNTRIEEIDEINEFTRLKGKKMDDKRKMFVRSVSQRQDDADADRDTLLSTVGSETSLT